MVATEAIEALLSPELILVADCELSITRVLGVQNGSFVLGLWRAGRWGPLACVVSSG
ncbi:MAG TPA: hypothetical protein VGI05_11870 [Streptosporangiaceae bacterium]